MWERQREEEEEETNILQTEDGSEWVIRSRIDRADAQDRDEDEHPYLALLEHLEH